MRAIQAISFSILIFAVGCSSPPPLKTQAYAKLKDHRTFEYEFPVVWKGIETAVKDYKVLNRDPEHVDDLEIKKLTHRQLATDWIFSESRDKYQTYQINGTPRKKYLEIRVKYEIDANSVMGGTDVHVKSTEEVERLKADGTPDGFESTQADTSRPAELLDRINNAILGAAP